MDYEILRSVAKGRIYGSINADIEVVGVEIGSMRANTDHWNVSLYCDMLLGFWPWCGDLDECVQTPEDMKGLVVDLAVDRQESEVELIVAIPIGKRSLCRCGIQGYAVDYFAEFERKAKQARPLDCGRFRHHELPRVTNSYHYR